MGRAPLRNAVRCGGAWAGAVVAGAVLAGCLTLPGHLPTPEFTPRIVDREYPVVWETLLAALRNEGAQVVRREPEGGVIDTAFRARPGTKVLTRGILGSAEMRQSAVEVRYSVRARPLGPGKTEVRLRTLIQYMDLGTQQWVPATDDGTLMETFWRRFEQDLRYYGAQPETWRPDEGRPTPAPPPAGSADVLPGGSAPGGGVR